MTVTVIYDSNGAITDYFDTEDLEEAEIEDLIPEDGGSIEIDDYPDPDSEYVLSDELTDRPTVTDTLEWFILSDGTEAAWFELSGAASVRISSEDGILLNQDDTEIASAGIVKFASSIVGAFTIHVVPPFPYQEARITVNVGDRDPLDPIPEAVPGSPSVVKTFTLGKPTPTGLAVSVGPKVARWTWNSTTDPRHDFYALSFYTSSADASSDTNPEVIAPIYENRFDDIRTFPIGAERWVRVSSVDFDGNHSPKSTPAVKMTARGAAAGDIEDNAVTDAKVDSTAPGTPTGLTLTQVARNTDGGDGRVEVAIRATWTAPTGGVPVKRYKLEITDGTDTWYEYAKQSSCKIAAVVGKTYTVKVSAESINAEGAQTSGVALAPVAKSAAPGSPTSVSIVAKAGQNKIKFTMPSDKDIAGANIYFNSSNNPGTAAKIASEVKSDDYIDATARAAGAACYYWVAAVTRSGVEGSKVAASNNPQSARIVQSEDIVPMAIVPSKLFPREFANLFSDPELIEADQYTITIGSGLVTREVNNGALPLGPSRFLLRSPASGVLSNEITSPIDIPVEAGLSYMISACIGGTADLGAGEPSWDFRFTPYIYADFYKVDVNGNPTVFLSSGTIAGPETIFPYRLEGVVGAPLGAQVMRLRFRKTRTVEASVNIMYVGSPMVRRMTQASEVWGGVIQKPAFLYVGGFTLSNDTTDPVNDIVIQPGRCSDNVVGTHGEIEIKSVYHKKLDALWEYGSSLGGRDTGSIADGTWHVFAIKDPTYDQGKGRSDIIFSQSVAPTMPAGFTMKRRIGSIIRSGGSIVAFKQLGDMFLLKDPILDVDVSDQGTTAVNRVLNVPTGIEVEALIRVVANNAANAYNVLLSPLYATNADPIVSAAPLPSLGNPANTTVRTELRVMTDTSGRIRSRSSAASTVLRISTYGWIDYRAQ